MRLLVIGSGTIAASLDPSELTSALGNAAWLSLVLAYYAGVAYAGDPSPDAKYLDVIDRAKPHTPAAPASPETLLAYANRRRKEITEGVDGNLGRLIQVTIPSGKYPVPIDATTRAALGDAAFQTTLANGDGYSIPAWLLPTGAFVALDADDIMTFAKAVAAAFQDVFAAQKAAFTAIATGAATSTAQVDAILGG